MAQMTHGSLFSGIGGFDLAAEWMGWENVFHCENNKFCQKILKYYWPNATSYGDIKETDFTEWRGKVDIVSGGFPCQPFSLAGKRKGTNDDRYLWKQMLRAAIEIQPDWLVGENVPGLLTWGKGMVLDEIKADLEAAGFEVFPPLVLPACSKNAPHKRERLWIVAHSHKERLQYGNGVECGELQNIKEWIQDNGEVGRSVKEQPSTHPNNQGLQRGKINGGIREVRKDGNKFIAGRIPSNWQDFPTVSPIRGGDDGLSSKLVKQCLEGLGNAVVPQVVYEIFKAIEKTSS